ncbi:MAG: hypothetical protein AAFU79_28160 [Myxococcota bacterium]
MTHFLFVRDDEDVLGIWEAPDEVAALKLRLSLQLTYPTCTTHLMAAPTFQAAKAKLPECDLDHLEPESIDHRF